MPDPTPDAVFETDLPLPGRRRGKVRDVYDLPGASASPARVVMIATDRVSAFDVVLPTPIAGKGRLLTGIAKRWFRWIESEGLCATHLVEGDAADLPIPADAQARLAGRVTIGRRCRVVPIECVVRGYLAGSGWVEYQASGTVCGVAIPAGLAQGDRLPEPIFTPATKAEQGAHDENIDFDRACAIAGGALMERLRAVSLSVYTGAAEYAARRGLLLADTKFEFGFPVDEDGGVDERPDRAILIDEALTPDSSRYWPAEDWRPGREQPSFDKQFVRDYLLGLVSTGQWNKSAPGPALPDAIVRNTLARYDEAGRRLFGDVAAGGAGNVQAGTEAGR